MIELAESLDELGTLVRARANCIGALLAMGDGDAAQIHATAGLEAAERSHDSSLLFRMLRYNTNLAIFKGEWEVAREFNARVLAEAPRGGFTLEEDALLNLQIGKYLELPMVYMFNHLS